MKQTILPLFLTITISLPIITMENEQQTSETQQTSQSQNASKKIQYSNSELLALKKTVLSKRPLGTQALKVLRRFDILDEEHKTRRSSGPKYFSHEHHARELSHRPNEQIFRELEGCDEPDDCDELPEDSDSLKKPRTTTLWGFIAQKAQKNQKKKK